ncbi:MAG: type II secretion system GspH family protein [Desulfobacterales bacterium]|jgi:prepilin-type N-terminal cleavage/methylation domain-containing protein|nr:type II secretion system GspH family protein [Desulfobacterales bacterium]
MKRISGFTVIELIVVMAIIGILLAVSTPNMIRWRQDHQLNRATRDIQATIQNLRIRAMKEKSSVEIVFDAVTNEYETRIYTRGVAGGRAKVIKYPLPPGIRISRITFRNSLLRFNSRGLTAGGAGSVSLVNQNGVVRRIVVPITGNSRITT